MKSRNLKNIVKCQNPEMVYDQDYNDFIMTKVVYAFRNCKPEIEEILRTKSFAPKRQPSGVFVFSDFRCLVWPWMRIWRCLCCRHPGDMRAPVLWSKLGGGFRFTLKLGGRLTQI